MEKSNGIYCVLAGRTFIDLAKMISDQIGIDGSAVAVAVNEYPHTNIGSPAPTVAITVHGERCRLNQGTQDRLFARIGQIVQDMRDTSLNEPFDAQEHPGLLITIGDDVKKFAYVVIVVDSPLANIKLDEIKLIHEISTIIDEATFCYNDDPAHPLISHYYGSLINRSSFYSYVLVDGKDYNA